MTHSFGIPDKAVGFRLCVLRLTKGGEERLDISETVIFTTGCSSVDTMLRRAAICGEVGEFATSIRPDQHHWIDLCDAKHDMLDVLPLSREAWNYLKAKTKARIRVRDACEAGK